MALRLVRKSSDTPNITNQDDVKMVRYAYGGIDGVVKDYGQELVAAYPTNGVFTIQSGRLVFQGWEIDVPEGGETITLYAPPSIVYYAIYLELNIISETATIKSTYGLSEYPEISAGDDLTEVPNGVARLPLYRFTLNNGVTTAFEKLIEIIPYAKDNYLSKRFEGAFEKDGQRVKHATDADNVGGSVADMNVWDIFDTETDDEGNEQLVSRVKSAYNAVFAEKATESSLSNGWKTTSTPLFSVNGSVSSFVVVSVATHSTFTQTGLVPLVDGNHIIANGVASIQGVQSLYSNYYANVQRVNSTTANITLKVIGADNHDYTASVLAQYPARYKVLK